MDYEDSVMKLDETEDAIEWVYHTLHKYGFAIEFNDEATEMFLIKDSIRICQVLDFDRLSALAVGMELVGDFDSFYGRHPVPSP